MGQGQVEVSQVGQVALGQWVEPQPEQVGAQEEEFLKRGYLMRPMEDWALEVGDSGVGPAAEQGEGQMTAGRWVGAYSGKPRLD